MGGAFLGQLPDEAVDILEPGDVIFTSEYDNFLSWCVMYFTSAEISHVLMYAGDSMILHATLSGVTVDPISSIYGANTRMLPLKLRASHEERQTMIERGRNAIGMPYSWRSVLRILVRILSGRDVPSFRFKFLLDAILVLAVLDIPFLLSNRTPTILWLGTLYVAVIIANRLLWRVSPPPAGGNNMKPGDVLLLLESLGAQRLWDGNAVNKQREISGLSKLHSITMKDET